MKVRERQYLERIRAAAETAIRRGELARIEVSMGPIDSAEPVKDVARLMEFVHSGAYVARSTLGIGRIPWRKRCG